MWVNCEERLLQCKVISGISDHKMISASFNMRVESKRVASFTCRSWRGVDVDSYVRDLESMDWSFLDNDNIENIWTDWKSTITNTMNNHSKIVQIKQSKTQSRRPWISSDILSLIRRKQAAEIRKDYFPRIIVKFRVPPRLTYCDFCHTYILEKFYFSSEFFLILLNRKNLTVCL